MAKIPEINISFRQLAASVVERSERSVAILIVKDETDTTAYKVYKDANAAEEDAGKYTEENMQAIRDVLTFSVGSLAVVRVKNDESVSVAGKIIESNLTTGWIALAAYDKALQGELETWIKAREKAGKTYKAIVYKATSPDSAHIVNFATEKVTFADERGEVSGDQYVPSLLGKIAQANIYQSVTRGKCENLTACAETEDEESAVSAGNLILTNARGAVYIVSGCTSLTTTDAKTKTGDMQYIETVEAMDMIADDIREAWKEQYEGRYKNSYDNQMLLVGAINCYLRDLEKIDVLDTQYENTSYIDADAQRDAWVSAGHTEVEDWTDAQVRQTPFKRSVFLGIDAKILGSMENLTIVVQLY